MTPGGPAAKALRRLLEYSWEDEARLFAAHPSDDHVYRHLVVLRNWLAGVGASDGSPLASLDNTERSQRLAGCPICDRTSGELTIESERWSVCHTHHLRWLARHNRVSTSEPSDRAIGNGDEFHNYQTVLPIPPADERDALS